MLKGIPYAVFVAALVVTITDTHATSYDNLSLKNAIDIALTNNLQTKISKQSVEIAEAQYQEAISARWPTLSFEGGFQRRDEAPTFTFPSSNIPLGGLSNAISAALGGAPVPSTITVPEQNIKLLDRDTTTASLKAMFPVYTGGKISSYVEQASLGKLITQKEVERTELAVIKDVKRYYYAAQLTQRLYNTAKNTAELLSDTRDLTKQMYEGGSETVNKLDFLKTEMAVSYAESIAQNFASKHESALAALANTMGVNWQEKLTLDEQMPSIQAQNLDLSTLIDQANAFNPQMGMLKLAIRVADAKIDEAKSGHLPKIAITADTTHFQNDYDAGLANSANRNSWTIGIGVSLPLFDGWGTTSRVSKAKLEHAQMQEKQKLVEQGIATMLKNLFIELEGANKQVSISQNSSSIADENISLTARAFQIGASKPQDLIESHLLGAMIKANLFKAQHDQLLKMAEIEYVLGSEIQP